MKKIIQNKKSIAFFILSIFFLNTQAQVTFQKTYGTPYGDAIVQVKNTFDGGYIMCGFASPLNQDLDIYLIRTDSLGDTIWTRVFRGQDIDHGYSVVQTTDSGFAAVGWTASFGAGDFDVLLIKTDSNGDTLWTKTYGGQNKDYANSISETADGSLIISGMTRSFGMGDYDVYLIKTQSNGNVIWAKTYGGIGYEDSYDIQQTLDGGFILLGSTGSFGSDIYLIKTDTSGNVIWKKAYGGASSDLGVYISQTSDSGYIIAGRTLSFGAGNWDAYIVKTDANGNILWSRTFGGVNEDLANSVQQTSDGGYIIAGYTFSFGAGSYDAYLIKTDINGDTLWTRTFGELYGDNAIWIEETPDKGYIFNSFTTSYGAGSSDASLIKIDSLGINGCNHGGTATIVTIPATQTTIPVTIVTSPATIVSSPSTVIGSGSIVTTVCSNVGINEIITTNSFLIFPNPSAGNFIISFEGTIVKGKVEILSILGENVFSESIFNESKKEINLKNVCDGIYFVKVFDEEKYFNKKIIIE